MRKLHLSACPAAPTAASTGTSTLLRFDAGELIFRESHAADHFYLICTGRIALETSVPGCGSLTVHTFGDGEVLGWSSLVPPYNSRFDARAAQMTRAIVFDGKRLRGLRHRIRRRLPF